MKRVLAIPYVFLVFATALHAAPAKRAASQPADFWYVVPGEATPAGDGGSRLELMQMPGIAPRGAQPPTQQVGLVHLAFDAGGPADQDGAGQQAIEACARQCTKIESAPHQEQAPYHVGRENGGSHQAGRDSLRRRF